MRILYCFLLVLGLRSGLALAQGTQPAPEPAHVAKDLAHLRRVLAPMPDSVRLDQLLEFVDVQVNAGHFEEAVAAVNEAADIAPDNPDFRWRTELSQGYLAQYLADFAGALRHYQRGLDLAEATHRYARQVRTLLRIAGLSYQTKDWRLANQAQQRALLITQQQHLSHMEAEVYNDLSNVAGMQNQPAKALLYTQKAQKLFLADHDTADYYMVLVNQGLVYKNLKQYAKSAWCFRQVLAYAPQHHEEILLAYAQINFPRTLLLQHQPDEAERYARQALVWAEKTRNLELLHEANDVLTVIKEQQGQYQAALGFQRRATRLQDSIFNQQKSQQLLTTEARYQVKARQARITQLAADNTRQQRQLWGLLGGLGLIGGLATVLARNNRQKHRANALLEEQKAALRTQRDQTSQALSELKATQAQLVQREKMASLGELTAGIAHEIQNPLNFVNNFSELSTELAGELREELTKHPAPNDGLTTELLDDLTQNLQKITQHGQRASRIVHGMLEHSRQSTGERRPTDLNALCEEYARLAYHGLRAKDKTFSAELAFDLAPHLRRVSLIGPDVGRVVLNLCANAFYAVQQRAQAADAPADYTPTVWVSTAEVGTDVVISIRDNGAGMPLAVQQKIFQPFFTTKPAGEGTGLGLSLSYDIITKGHGGTLAVKSQEGQGTELLITLPTGRAGTASA